MANITFAAGFLLGLCEKAEATQSPSQDAKARPRIQTLDSQEQRDRAAQDASSRLETRNGPSTRLQSPSSADYRARSLPREASCFNVARITLEGAHSSDFRFVERYLSRYAGRCIGSEGVAVIVRRASDLIIDRGFVTTRIGVGNQDLSTGTLRLTVVPGVIHAVGAAPAEVIGTWRTALPSRPGDLLNVRDLEQALEQFKRLPSQDVSIDIVPVPEPGHSDLVISGAHSRPLHLAVTLDNSGARSTGRLQAGITTTLDNPMRINDVLSLGYTRDPGHGRGHGAVSQSLSYGVPFGSWLIQTSLHAYAYHQTLVGSRRSFTASGKSRAREVAVSRMAHRTAVSRTSLELRVRQRAARSYIEDVELHGQRRHVTSADVSVVHRQFFGRAQADIRLTRRQGVGWLGGQGDARSRVAGEPTFRYRMQLVDAALNIPLNLGGGRVAWLSEFRFQRSNDVLHGSEFFALGGRYSIRGFDGERTVGGERGWHWRNTLSVPLGRWPVELYAGVDTGHVGGPSLRGVAAKTLRGEFVGARGRIEGFSFDVFAGVPDKGGRAMQTMRPVMGFQIAYRY